MEYLTVFKGEGFFFLSNLPIKWVRVVGMVVAIDQFANKRCFTIDDSSGMCIEALVDLPNPAKTQSSDADEATPKDTRTPIPDLYDHVEVGHAVDVKGQLTIFRNERQIRVEKIAMVKSTAQEVALWEKRDKFRREVLGKQWTVNDKQLRRCRKEAERSDAESERRKQRIKAIATRNIGRDGAKRKDEGEDDQGERRQKKASIKMEELLRIAARGEGDYSALGL